MFGPQVKFVFEPLWPNVSAGIVEVMGFDSRDGSAARAST